MGTSLVTIRSDLDALAEQGKLVRMAGGAILPSSEGPQTHHYIENIEQKREIATNCAAHINDGDTLFINSGTTTTLVAEALRTKKNLNIVTNSLPIATLLGGIPTFRVILLGGTINPQFFSLTARTHRNN